MTKETAATQPRSAPPRTRLGLAIAAASLLLGASFGCGADIRFAAPPQSMLQGGVSVTFQKAVAEDDELQVRFWIMNMSDQVMLVNRDGFGLRLPSGEVLERRGIHRAPYAIPPGAGHNVWVTFEGHGFKPKQLPAASVIVGGIFYANDPVPRVVGEIPITAAGPED